MISHQHKFIYTRIPKTGSTSVTGHLTENMDELRDKQHRAPWHILDEINPRTLDYFKFTFVRNPWERCVSRYFWERYFKGRWAPKEGYLNGNSTFAEFAKSKGPPYGPNDERKFYVPLSGRNKRNTRLRGNLRRIRIRAQKSPWENQLDWISDENGVVLTDFVGRFENLQEDFNIVCDKIGIPQRKLPHKHKSEHKHYTEYYDEESKQIVAEKYAKDIEYFGYKFGE